MTCTVRPITVLRVGRPLAAVLAVTVLAAPAGASARVTDHRAPTRPTTYVVSRDAGVLPEGIGLGRGDTFYVTSSGTGAIYRGDLRHRNMNLFLPGGSEGRGTAAGVHVDRFGRVFVARPAGLDVYSRSGHLLAHRAAPDGAVGAPSLNDLVFTHDAVYVTDFANPVVLRASLDHGRIGPLRPWLDVADVEPQLPAQFWFLNGIVVSANQRTLLVSSQGLEQLLRVDIARRAPSVVDLGATTFAADGLELSGTTLHAVVNYDPPSGSGVYRAELAPDLASGRVVASSTGGLSPFDSPTTLARTGRRLLVVNSQFDHAPGTPPFTVSTLRIS